MFWLLIVIVYLFFPLLAYAQYKKQKRNGLEPDYTFQIKDLRSNAKVPESIQLMRTGIWTLVITVLSIFPLMGLPGGLLIELLHLFGILPADKLAGEDLWPAALVVSFTLPFGWPLAVLVRNLGAQSNRVSPTVLFWSVLLLWVFVLIMLLVFMM
ncbi:MAG: hypothetical protein IPM34_06775 [Saprospiraceae bacterium]|nr:hypothetical protein [Saprospiraceae bacterium]